jgi:hypothetical protein
MKKYNYIFQCDTQEKRDLLLEKLGICRTLLGRHTTTYQVIVKGLDMIEKSQEVLARKLREIS